MSSSPKWLNYHRDEGIEVILFLHPLGWWHHGGDHIMIKW